MPRNQKFPLNAEQSQRADWAREALEPFTAKGSRHVQIGYTKRSGDSRVLKGKALEITGEGSNEVVKVMTDNGVRSANLWGIRAISNDG